MNFFSSNKSNKKKENKKSEKEMRRLDENRLSEVSATSYQIKGMGTKKVDCQDTMMVLDQIGENCGWFFAVLDGHGSSGKEASNAAFDAFQGYFTEKHIKKLPRLTSNKEREKFLFSAFKSTEKKLKKSGIDYSNSGTCCVMVYIKDNGCTIANLGDSRAVLCRWIRDKMAIELSTDHKPTNKEEKARILKKKGRVERKIVGGQPVGPMRVWIDDEGPGIAMTRTLGDFQAKTIGLISEPEIKHIELKPGDRFIVIGSDGLWDVMSSAEVVGFVLKHCGEGVDGRVITQAGIAEALTREAKARWEESHRSNKQVVEVGDVCAATKKAIDDISAVVVFLKFSSEEETNLTEPLIIR